MTGVVEKDAPVTPAIVRGLWRHMMRLYKTSVFEKKRAPEMYIVSEALARLGIADREGFMREWSTTLGRRIYVPYAESPSMRSRGTRGPSTPTTATMTLPEGSQHNHRSSSEVIRSSATLNTDFRGADLVTRQAVGA